jgi:hypothetical protein
MKINFPVPGIICMLKQNEKDIRMALMTTIAEYIRNVNSH